jgi:hypothetical protein
MKQVQAEEQIGGVGWSLKGRVAETPAALTCHKFTVLHVIQI